MRRQPRGGYLIVRYRSLLETDVVGIARVHRRACLIAYKFMNWSYSESDVRNWYAGKFNEWDWGLVAEDNDGVIVGFTAVAGPRLDQLFVEPGHQGQGIGTRLLTEALRCMPAVATLNVFEQNTQARRFYERHGFREVRRFLNTEEKSVELVYARDGEPRSSN